MHRPYFVLLFFWCCLCLNIIIYSISLQNIGKNCYSLIEMSWPYLESSVFCLTQLFYLTHCLMFHKCSFAKFSSARSQAMHTVSSPWSHEDKFLWLLFIYSFIWLFLQLCPSTPWGQGPMGLTHVCVVLGTEPGTQRILICTCWMKDWMRRGTGLYHSGWVRCCNK